MTASPAATDRHDRVLSAAVRVAQRVGWPNMTRELVAAEAGVAVGTVNNAMGLGGTMRDLRDAVMVEAVRIADPGIVGQGLAAGHAAARGAPAELKQAAMAALV